MPTISTPHQAPGLRIAVLVARWHPEIVDRLLAGALEAIARLGVAEADVTTMEVPGSYELPQAAMRIAKSGRVDAIVALGCVIRGETQHAELLERAASQGLLDVALQTGVPVGFGVVTAQSRAQAEARSDAARSGKGGHKGVEAAEAAVRLAASLRAWETRS